MHILRSAIGGLAPAIVLAAGLVAAEPQAAKDDAHAGQAAPTTQATDTVPVAAKPQEAVKKGVRVEFTIEGTDGLGEDGSIMAGALADVRFRVSDAETGAPVSPLEPAVWISRAEGAEALSCREKIGRYLQGMLSFQAEVDLNKYFIMILNNDQSISVVDPLMGVSGITQLYAMVILEGRGEDWTRSADDKLLFVTMPQVGKVAAVDLETFKVIRSVEAGKNPVRISLQPDGRYLWVGNDGVAEADSGVTVLDARTQELVAHIATGAGHHEIAFSDDSLVAFVTNGAADTLSVIDIQRLEKVDDLPTGSGPLAVQFSELRQAAYVASRDGTVAVVDSGQREIVSRIETGPGLTAFRLAPSGRWGFIANGDADRVDVIDISSGAIAHRLDAGDQPHQFAFTDTYAYVRHLGTAEVLLIPLNQLSLRTVPGLQRVAFGSRSPGEYPYPASADAISPTGEWTAVVSANPADLTVHYYMEGMIAPMGSYSTYGRVPRAVGVVDRSVRETERGVYTARFRVPSHGDYDVAFLIDSPFVDHCFTFSAQENPQLAAELERNPVRLVYLNEQRSVPAGEPIKVRFTLTSSRSEEPLTGLKDVVVLATRPPGSWQERTRAKPLEKGLYEVMVPADLPGAYYVSVAVPSLGLDFTELPYISFLAAEGVSSAKQTRGD